MAIARGSACGPLLGVPVTIKESFAYRGISEFMGLAAIAACDQPSHRRCRRPSRVRRRNRHRQDEYAGDVDRLADVQPDLRDDEQSVGPDAYARRLDGRRRRGAGRRHGRLDTGQRSQRVDSHPRALLRRVRRQAVARSVSMAGFQPGPWDGSPGLPMDIAVVGPLARSAGDLRLALEALGGSDGDDARAWTWRLPAPRHTRLEGFRVGYVMDDPRTLRSAPTLASCTSGRSRSSVAPGRRWSGDGHPISTSGSRCSSLCTSWLLRL